MARVAEYFNDSKKNYEMFGRALKLDVSTALLVYFWQLTNWMDRQTDRQIYNLRQ